MGDATLRACWTSDHRRKPALKRPASPGEPGEVPRGGLDALGTSFLGFGIGTGTGMHDVT